MSRKKKKKNHALEQGTGHLITEEPLPEYHDQDSDELEQVIREEGEADIIDAAPVKGIVQSTEDELFGAPREYQERSELLQRAGPLIISGIILALLFGLVAVLLLGSQFLRAQNEAARVRTSFDSIKASISNLDFRTALLEFPKGQDSIRSLRMRVDSFPPLSWIPYIGPRIQETNESLHALEKYFLAGERLLGIIADIGTKIFIRPDQTFDLYMRTLTREDKRAILDTVTRSVPIIQGIHATLRLTQRDVDQIDLDLLSSELASALHEARSGGAYLASLIETWLPLAEVLPLFLGYPDEKTYLILLQDTSEVRATGGFISHYGILKLHNGEITELRTDNVYNLDDRTRGGVSIPPPEPMRRHFPQSTPRWYLRDSNWAPDFSESARQAGLFYRLEGGDQGIDGVLAATPELVRSLLRFTGPIRVEERDYGAENLIERLEFEVQEGHYRRGIKEAKRKEIFGQLVARIGEKLIELPLTKWLDLYTMIEARLNEKNVLLYFHDPRLQEFARKKIWTGEIRTFPGDFLMVVDTAFATLKTESVMDKRMSYTMREDRDGYLVARLDLTYTNRAVFTDVTTTYRDWVRLYVPDGSKLIQVNGIQKANDSDQKGTLEITKKYGKLEFAGYFTVEPRHTKTITVEYRLPDRLYQQVQQGTYSLLLQKQPGLSNQRLEGHLSFVQPIESYQPLGFFNVRRAESKIDIFHDYRTDQTFTVMLKKK